MNLIQRVIDGFGPEDCEQYAFVQYLEYLQAQGHPLKFTSVPNATYTKSVMQRTRNSLLGLRPGLGDMFIAYRGLWVLSVEMKRLKTKTERGQLTPAQREWIELLSTIPNVEAVKADGCEEAMKVLDSLLPPLPLVADKQVSGSVF